MDDALEDIKNEEKGCEKMSSDVCLRFWLNYLGADELKRITMCETLTRIHFNKRVMKVLFKKLNEKEFERSMASSLKSYFDDLIISVEKRSVKK